MRALAVVRVLAVLSVWLGIPGAASALTCSAEGCASTLPSVTAGTCGIEEACASTAACPRGCNLVNNCHAPQLLGTRIDILPQADGTADARLVLDVRATWNLWASQNNPSGTLDVDWFDRATVPDRCDGVGAIARCDYSSSDRAEVWLERSGLTCEGAPYDFGTFSAQLKACAQPCPCEFPRPDCNCPRNPLWQTWTDVPGLRFVVTAADLGCPEPPKWSCGGDSTCRDCLAVGPGQASPAGDGASASPPASGPGALLRYRAGGAGGPNWPGTAAWNQALGRYWSHDYAERIVEDPDAGHVWLLTRHATFREFTDADADGLYETVSPSDEHRALVKTAAGWELRDLDGTVQHFDATGRWMRTVDRNGNEKAAQYSAGALARVTFPDGRREDFAYHPDGKLHTITEVGVDGATSRTWTYTWEGLDLKRIDRPDGTAWEMFYADPDLPGYLTRLDLRGSGPGTGRVETAWEYDNRGNVARIWRGDPSWSGPAAVERHELTYDNPALPTETEVADPLGRVSVYGIGRDPGGRKPRMTSIAGDCPSCGLGPVTAFEYADPANPLLPTAIVDAKGHRTEMAYDARGRLVSKTEAVGTALVRETTWEHHPQYPAFPVRIDRPSVAGGLALRSTVMTYDAEGNLLTRTETGEEDGSPFSLTTTMTYNAAGQVLTIDPPGHGAADVTSFTYDPVRGDLVPLAKTEPLVGTTVYAHDAFNRRTGVTDVNGVPALTTYDALNRVTAVVQEGDPDLVTTYEHTVFGDLFRTTLPEGNVLEYAYDAAGRLISVERKPDAATPGERTFYTLDAVGHRTRADLQRRDGAAWVTESWTESVYSSRCHLDKMIRPGGAVTEYAYDCNGNLEKVWDANHPKASNPVPTQSYQYDELDRLTSLAQPWPGGGAAVTSYGYDVQDHLTRVTDAESNVTTYAYSDRDLMTEQDSPASGVTTYGYNDHGNLETETDARGITVTRVYDALDRLTAVIHPDPSLNVAYTYDAPGAFAKGRLAGIARHGETIAYEYDRFGRVTKDGALTYAYDGNGNRTTIGYPGGVTATYTYDHADRPATLTLSDGASPPLALVAGADYKPFGPLASLALGNGLSETRTFNERYEPAAIRVAGASPLLHWSYATDAVGNISSIQDVLDPANDRTFSYVDTFYFLSQGDGPWGPRAWTYDRIGNRLTESRGPATDVYAYEPSPRLKSVGTRLYSYDEAGNTLQIQSEESQLDLVHDAASRLAFLRSLSEGKLVAFTYDGRGYLRDAQEIEAACFPSRTTATYSSEGLLHGRERRLIEDGTFLGSDLVFYFAGRPVANLSSSQIGSTLTYLSPDHLGSPVLATSDSGALVWEGGFEPFGEDWNGAAGAGVFLRLPGQWEDEAWGDRADGEGLYYNVHRYLQPGIGRYTSPDPLGLGAGINSYAYSQNRPTLLIDPDGRASVSPDPAINPGLSIPGYVAGCMLRIAEDYRQFGQAHGWRWVHCMSSCEIAKQCGGPALARVAGYGKEVADTLRCIKDIVRMGVGFGDYCESAMQETDFQDNERGFTCPRGEPCEARCGYVKNVRNRVGEEGPLWGLPNPIFSFP